MSESVHVRANLEHPVVDADGHWLEPVPLFLDFLRDEGGAGAVDAWRRFDAGRGRWYEIDPATRATERLSRWAWWGEPAETVDRATAILPGLLYDRLDEMGIDFTIIYPTLAFSLRSLADPDLRRPCIRALNRMNAELFAPFSDRMTPAATISIDTPEEAVDEMTFAVRQLGMKVVMASGCITRHYERDGKVDSFVDTIGLDSVHDYDPLWAACQDLGVAFTDHGGSLNWPDRRSHTNFVFNHIGHFANAQHASCRGIFLGGVTRRFPELKFAFLEGGVGWACGLMLDLIGHWSKRNVAAMHANLRPSNIDRAQFEKLYNAYATGPLQGRFADIYNSISCATPFMNPDEQTDREQDSLDDFAASQVGSVEELAAEFRRNFFFGCEADDPMTGLAFSDDLGVKLRPLFSSDVGHWDVVCMADVLEEAWELVEHARVTESQFRDFTFSNVVDLHTSMNKDFFRGTVVENAVAAHLAS